MINSRRHSRERVALKARYLNRGELARDLVVDLSPGGLFLSMSTPDMPEVGIEVDVEITIEDGSPPTHVRGRVAWVRPPPHPEPGIGIQFIGLMGPALLDIVRPQKSPTP